MRKRDDARLLVIDIGSGNTDVARQFNVTSIPALWLYEDGEKVSTDIQQVFDRLSN